MTYKQAAPFQGKTVKITLKLTQHETRKRISPELAGTEYVVEVSRQGWLKARQTVHYFGQDPRTRTGIVPLRKILAIVEVKL
jgi:hypothetical protein